MYMPVAGFDGEYLVSASGSVYSKKSRRCLRPSVKKRGYMQVVLSHKMKRKTCLIHRLVAEAFMSAPPTAAHEINHKDFNTKNNHVSNLEWVTRSENIMHSYSNPKRKPHPKYWKGKKYSGNSQSMVVVASRGDGFGLVFFGLSEAQEVGGFNAGHISECIRGKRSFHRGFKWARLSMAFPHEDRL